ncbi:hypothetical protein Ate02nite_50190 [Paractinoplanes tereljensis]|uniref:Uncharacterized protein n=1 Tax=Paractinoplanes tereljensis TaxID=571912 RepID=A0A919NQP8_9ACTN|nr:hypothetical protein [Actinoplanes tereljensis]GIF22289.1 hypothetical protein Ate02nite_50190 [Actinoplanes tereljensis]
MKTQFDPSGGYFGRFAHRPDAGHDHRHMASPAVAGAADRGFILFALVAVFLIRGRVTGTRVARKHEAHS